MSVLEFGNAAATLLILRATQVLTPASGVQTATQSRLYVAYNVFATLASIPAGYLSDQKSPVLVVALGALVFAGAYLAFTGATLTLMTLGFVLAGFGIGFLETGQHAAVAAIAPEALRGSAFGLLAAVQSFGGFIASALAGFALDSVLLSANRVSLSRCLHGTRGRKRSRTSQPTNSAGLAFRLVTLSWKLIARGRELVILDVCFWPNADVKIRLSIRPLSGVKQTLGQRAPSVRL